MPTSHALGTGQNLAQIAFISAGKHKLVGDSLRRPLLRADPRPPSSSGGASSVAHAATPRGARRVADQITQLRIHMLNATDSIVTGHHCGSRFVAGRIAELLPHRWQPSGCTCLIHQEGARRTLAQHSRDMADHVRRHERQSRAAAGLPLGLPLKPETPRKRKTG